MLIEEPQPLVSKDAAGSWFAQCIKCGKANIQVDEQRIVCCQCNKSYFYEDPDALCEVVRLRLALIAATEVANHV